MSVSRAHIQTTNQTNKQTTNTHTPHTNREAIRKRKREGEKRERAPCIHLHTGQRVELCNSCTVDVVFSAVLLAFLFDAVIVVTYAVSLFSALHSLQHSHTPEHGSAACSGLSYALPMTTLWYNSSTNLRCFLCGFFVAVVIVLSHYSIY